MSDTKRDIVERINGDVDDYDERYDDGMTHAEGFDLAERMVLTLYLASKEIVRVRTERDAAIAVVEAAEWTIRKSISDTDDHPLVLRVAAFREITALAAVPARRVMGDHDNE